MNTLTKSLVVVLAVTASAACGRQTRYEDPGKVETVDSNFGGTDLLMIADTMAQSFASSAAWEGDKPRIVFGGVQNRTTQHIDTQNITDTIRTALIQSGKFTVLAGDQGLGEIEKEVDYQGSGWVNEENAVQVGQQLGADYVLYGRFTEIKKQVSDTKSRWMKFTLNAVDVESRAIAWADEQQIAKVEQKGGVGW